MTCRIRRRCSATKVVQSGMLLLFPAVYFYEERGYGASAVVPDDPVLGDHADTLAQRLRPLDSYCCKAQIRSELSRATSSQLKSKNSTMERTAPSSSSSDTSLR